MRTFYCNLPWPPSVNTYYTVWKGRKILSKNGKQFKSDCRAWVHRLPDPIKGSIKVEIQVCMPDKRKRDLDNLLKPILDVLGNYGVYEDDSQISELSIKKIDDGQRGIVQVNIEEISK